MAAEKTLALVLKVVEFSESSCIVTLMTRDFGKIATLAKGARRRKSPYEGALDLLSISRIVFLHKKSESLDLLTEAKLERRFRSAAVDLNRLYSGYYVAELLNELTDENDPIAGLFQLASETLIAIDDGKETAFQLLQFELGALNLLGHRPMLEQCVGCGRGKQFNDLNVQFGLRLGGILCATCRKGKTSVVSLSASAWQMLLRLIKPDSSQPIDELGPNQGEIRQFMNQYISHHLGHRPKMQKYLATIKTGIK